MINSVCNLRLCRLSFVVSSMLLCSLFIGSFPPPTCAVTAAPPSRAGSQAGVPAFVCRVAAAPKGRRPRDPRPQTLPPAPLRPPKSALPMLLLLAPLPPPRPPAQGRKQGCLRSCAALPPPPRGVVPATPARRHPRPRPCDPLIYFSPIAQGALAAPRRRAPPACVFHGVGCYQPLNKHKKHLQKKHPKTPYGAKKSMRKKLTIAPCQHPTQPSVRRNSDLSPTFCPSEIFSYLCP